MYLLFLFLLNINFVNSVNVSVLGAGYSGMVSALELNKLGYNVSIYEKNDFVGGRSYELFLNNDSYFNSGPSWYWMPQTYENIFNNYLTNNISFYELDKLNNSFKLFYNNTYLEIPNNIKEIFELFDSIDKNNKVREFIKIAEANYKFSEKFMFNKYNFFDIINFNNIKNLNNYFGNFDTHINKFTNSNLIKSLLKWPVIFIGNNPKTSPSFYSLLTYIGYNNGTYYPKNGMNAPIKKLDELLNYNNIPIYYNSEITDFIYKNNLIDSLCFKNSSCIQTQGVISAIDYNFLEQTILDKKYRYYSKEYWENINLAPQCLTYYLIVNNTNNLDKLDHHNFFGDINNKIDNIFQNKLDYDPLFYVNKIKYDNHTNIFILAPLHYDLNINTSYNEVIYNTIINKIENYIGNISIIHRENINSYNYTKLFNSYKGNAFGVANNLNQSLIFKPKMKSKINNLIYVGQTTHPGPGIVPSMISGIIGANLLDDYFNDKYFVKFNIFTLIFTIILVQLIIICFIISEKIYLSYAYCIYLFYKNGKTYFAASLLFPFQKLIETASLYSVFRIADDYVDNNNHYEVKEKNLNIFMNNFYKCINSNNGDFNLNPCFPAAIENIVKYKFDIKLFTRFFKSMKMDLEITEYDSLPNLYKYMDGSASVIGEFMIIVLDIPKKYRVLSIPYAKELGNAFQFTNMIRDIKEDYKINRIYIPKFYFNKFKIKLDENGNCNHKDMNFRLFMEDLFYEATKMYNIAYYGIQYIPYEYRDVIKCAFINYKSIHDKIRENEYNIFDKKVSISFRRKLFLMINNISFRKILTIFFKYSFCTYINLFIKNIHIVLLAYYICLINIINIEKPSYLLFHILFTIPFIIKFVIINKIYYIFDENINKKSFIIKFVHSTCVMILLACVYTTPWDSYLISQKIWSYDEDNVLFRYNIFSKNNIIPFEEYLFFVLQTILCSLVLLFFINKHGIKYNKLIRNTKGKYMKLNSILLIYLLCIFYISNISLYLFYILIWSFPIFFIQLNYNINTIINNKKIIINSVIYSSVFLCIIDYYAIKNFIWDINNDYIMKSFTDYITILPIEEIIFFIVSSSMCILGNVLFLTHINY